MHGRLASIWSLQICDCTESQSVHASHAACWVQREQLLKELGTKLREARSAAQAAKPAATAWEGSLAPFLSALKAFALTRASEAELVGPLPARLHVCESCSTC